MEIDISPVQDWGKPKEGLILVGKDIEPRIGLMVNHAFADKGIGVIIWLGFGADVARVRWLRENKESLDGYNCGVCGSYVLALAEINAGEILLGKDVVPSIGMRVVGAVNSGYEKMGKGTVTQVVEKNGISCNVTWDNSGAGQKFGYCTGFHNRHHLALIAETPNCSDEVEDIVLTPESKNAENEEPGPILVGKDIKPTTGLRVRYISDHKVQDEVGTIVALREGGNVCDVRWDSGDIQTGIATGLLQDFQLALADELPLAIVIGRDIKPSVGMPVRPLTYSDSGGVDGVFDSTWSSRTGKIVQLLSGGDVVVKWQTGKNEAPRGGIYQTGRHGAYFLALDTDRTIESARQKSSAAERTMLQKLLEEEAKKTKPDVLICGKNIASAPGQRVYSLPAGDLADMGRGVIHSVDAGGLGVMVRWDTGELTKASTGRFGVFDLGLDRQNEFVKEGTKSSLFGNR